MEPSLLVMLLLALGFAYTNGFHDSANAIATSVSTKALTPRIALLLASAANLLGAFFGTRVAETVGEGIIGVEGPTFALVSGSLIGATAWNLATWWRGLPSSSTHALVGGMVGAALATGASIQWDGVLWRVAVPMVLSPVVGLILGWVMLRLLVRVLGRRDRRESARSLRSAQTVSAAAMAFGHGMQDAAKVAGMIVLALVATGRHDPAGQSAIPWWTIALSGAVMSVGTYAGGWRIIRTLGARMVSLTPAQGFAAEAAAAITLAMATAFRAPISTTYTITSAIAGAGSAGGVRSVRWDVARGILAAWVLTLPGAALVAGLVALLLDLA